MDAIMCESRLALLRLAHCFASSCGMLNTWPEKQSETHVNMQHLQHFIPNKDVSPSGISRDKKNALWRPSILETMSTFPRV